MKVLLVEDDVALGEALHEVLNANEFESTWVKTAEDAQRFLDDEVFDIHLFDIVLPGKCGLTLLKWCQSRGIHNPIMMLTARDGVTDRVIGLDSGADDYLGKPFAIEELLSRMRVLLRRQLQQKTAVWHFGALAIDTARHQVSLNQAVVALSKREYEILHKLAASPDRVLTRSQLAEGSDAADAADSNAVGVHIFSLRKKLEGVQIVTVRGVGYFLETSLTAQHD
jgi:DNA-binding response OmpR family regulator